jgi:hypothetical protein
VPGTQDDKREHILSNQVLLGPGDGKACCHNWLKCVYGVRSNDQLYGVKRGAKERKEEKRISIIAWFQELLLVADKMPDTPDYILPAPSRRAVHNWYAADVASMPKLYTKASDLLSEDLARILSLCQVEEVFAIHQVLHLCKVAADSLAMEKLKEHYAYIKKERGYARRKRHQALTNPDDVISIAIVGCENLGLGFPHFP